MPEQAAQDFVANLSRLQDKTLVEHLQSNNYGVIQEQLDSNEEITEEYMRGILSMCCLNLKEDVRMTPSILNIINAVIKRVKQLPGCQVDLVASAIATMFVIKSSALRAQVKTFKFLSFNTLLNFPDETLIRIAESHPSEVIEVLNLLKDNKISFLLQYQTLKMLHKFLSVIPKEKIEIFLRDNLVVWFSKIIPFVLSYLIKIEEGTDLNMLVEVMEMIADGLANTKYTTTFRYTDSWKNFLQYVANSNKYPALMKSLLEKPSDVVIWHRVWIVIVKLVKNHLTMKVLQFGTPINSILSVVETAFKMDPSNRCKAFQCWNILIDIFSQEKNETSVDRTIKLLIVPLWSNNAKVIEVALAKHETWWCLIKQYEAYSHKLNKTVILPFLHFSFGKCDDKRYGKRCFVMTDTLKVLSLQTLAELSGHSKSCKCDITVPRLANSLLNSTFLVNHWSDWIFSLRVAITTCADLNEQSNSYLSCVWISFLTIVAGLPPNNVRKDLFNELLMLMTELENNTQSTNIFKLTFEVMKPPLFDADIVKTLLETKIDDEDLATVVFNILNLEQSMDYFKSTDNNISLDFLSHLFHKNIPKVDIVVEKMGKVTSERYIPMWHYLANLLIKTVEKNLKVDACPLPLILWIIKSENIMKNASQDTRKLWCELVSASYTQKLSKEVFKVLQNYKMFSVMDFGVQKFVITAVAHLINQSWNLPTEADYEFVRSVIGKLLKYKDFEEEIQMFVSSVLSEHKFTGINDMHYTKTVHVLMTIMIEDLIENPEHNQMKINFKKVITSVKAFLTNYTNLDKFSYIFEKMSEFWSKFDPSPTKKTIFEFLLEGVKKISPEEAIYKKIQNIIKQTSKNTSTTPKTKQTRSKNKEASIASTYVENGEEFVVIMPNWKFNKRKLTENQKEKLERKREDIPALYQDLSQSQDSKLMAWKTDSQDASLSNSKSNSKTGNGNVSLTLQDVTDKIIPEIIQNITEENIPCNHDKIEKQTKINTVPINKEKKEKKVHRMALKDRVVKNVQILIEKSGLQKDNKDSAENLNKTNSKDVPGTPESNAEINKKIFNSAPPKILTNRPARVKRKPKKFDNPQIILMNKRKRTSLCQFDSLSESSENSECAMFDENPELSTIENNEVISDNTSKTNNICVFVEIADLKGDTSIEDSINEDNNKDVCTMPVNTEEIIEKIPIENNSSPNKDKLEVSDEENKVRDINSPQPLGENDTPKTTSKKRKSQICNQLSITEAEAHLFSEIPSGKRTPRRCVANSITNVHLKKTPKKVMNKSEKVSEKTQTECVVVNDSIADISTADDYPMSEDIIESSQDSTITTVSVKSTKSKKSSLVLLDSLQRKDTTPEVPKKDLIEKKTSKEVVIKDSLETIAKTPSPKKIVYETNNENSGEKTSPSKVNSNVSPLPVPIVVIQDLFLTKKTYSPNKKHIKDTNISLSPTFPLTDETNVELSIVENHNTSNDDTVLLQNKTVMSDKDLTENMDTEPLENKELSSSSDSVILLSEDKQQAIVIESEIAMGTQTQELAEVDTLTFDPAALEESTTMQSDEKETAKNRQTEEVDNKCTASVDENKREGKLKPTTRLSDISVKDSDASGVSSPFKDDDQRQQDFLNNTLEISPIKQQSPIQDATRTSPVENTDYVLIKLSSPVHSNGEPFDKCDSSPEIFTNDKNSPDKRDQSPPREEVVQTNTSPRSLSLKKNRSQVRPTGRGAQMLGLCVPDRQQSIGNSDKQVDPEESRKTNTLNTPARRNLRLLYNAKTDNCDNESENESGVNFLKFKRTVPTAECNPSGPILKRKLVDIADEATISPASKRKRVSFHDPPVSTTVAVQKYIEPPEVRSPQNSLKKKLERQPRMLTNAKSQRRLENVFNLDNILTKTVESFEANDVTIISDDTQMSSEQTPAAEVVKTSDLNDSDPICPDLVDCKDPIENIASELSSPSMRTLLIKELEGKVETVGDLARLSELEVNRLCIKSPKVSIAKKVLSDYLIKIKDASKCSEVYIDLTVSETTEPKTDSSEVNTETISTTNEMEIQTETLVVANINTQTDNVVSKHCESQTDESGSKSTEDIIKTMLTERTDFIDELNKQLDDKRKAKIFNSLPFDQQLSIVMEATSIDNNTLIMNKALENQHILDSSNESNKNKELAFSRKIMLSRFKSKELILYCSQLLHDLQEH